MKPDELLNKFLEGELSPEQYDEAIAGFSEDDKKQHDELLAKPETVSRLAKKSQEEMGRVSGLRKAARAIDEGQGIAKLREENLSKAKTRFFAQYGIPSEQQAEYSDAFEKSGNKDVSEEFIFDALEDIYVHKNKKSLLGKAKERDEMVQGADDFNASQAGAPGSGGEGGDSGKKKDPKVLEWMKEFEKQGKHISYEDAERVLTRGLTRKFE